MKLMFILFAMLMGASSWAFERPLLPVSQMVAPKGLDWKVGDNADYQIDIGFLKGTMHSTVRNEDARGFWVVQDIDLKIQKQKVEILYDKNTGAVLEIIVNGQKQTPPDPSDMELVDMKESHVEVPAGSFDCIYVKVRNKKENKISEAWLNPEEVPIGGLLKTIAQSPIGPVNVQLTAFKKQ
ncbi:MAG: hypothetical protein D6797_04360 [Bdellovibrio sp.]|nr:MAG: hypothetical protein D6797_04360 [Bdellovibrio sp.]